MGNPITLHGDIIDEIRRLPVINIYHHILIDIEGKYNSGKMTQDNFDAESSQLIINYINDRENIRKRLKEKITVVDSIMGSGKSSYIIKYINDNPDLKFICIVPTIEEIDRYMASIIAETYQPKNIPLKKDGLKKLIFEGKNIVTTHALISYIDADMIKLLQSSHYVLVIDECLDVVHQYKRKFGKGGYSGPRKPQIRRFGNRRSGELETVIPANRKPARSVIEPLVQASEGPLSHRAGSPQRSGPGIITRSGSCPARTPLA